MPLIQTVRRTSATVRTSVGERVSGGVKARDMVRLFDGDYFEFWFTMGELEVRILDFCCHFGASLECYLPLKPFISINYHNLYYFTRKVRCNTITDSIFNFHFQFSAIFSLDEENKYSPEFATLST